MKLHSILYLTVSLLATQTICANPAVVTDSLQIAQNNCAKLKARLEGMPDTEYRYVDVPVDYENSSKGTLKLFYWIRHGKDRSFPPLVHLHGGPVNDSSFIFLRLNDTIVPNYPGDLIAFDHRGDGCSKEKKGDMAPSEYTKYNLRNIAADIHFVHEKFHKNEKWRLYGQSRGSMLAFLVLEKFPQMIESVHAAAGLWLPHEDQLNYPIYRAQGMANLLDVYFKQYPDDAKTFALAKVELSRDPVCFDGTDDAKICGPGALDMQNLLMGRRASWPDFHKKIAAFLNPDGTINRDQLLTTLKNDILGDPYSQFGYLVGTNGYDMACTDKVRSLWIKKNNPDLYYKPVVSELRYTLEIIAALPKYKDIDWNGQAIDFNFLETRANISKFKIPVFSYNGDTDPIFPTPIVDSNKKIFGDLISFITLPESGHNEAWYHALTLKNLMLPTEAYSKPTQNNNN